MEEKKVIIYCLQNKINGKQYVGQTSRTLKRRMQGHIEDSRRKNRPINEAILKYGKENFAIFEIEQCEKSNRHEREAYWIEYLGTCETGYNLMKRSGHSEDEMEQIAKEFLSGATQVSLSKKHNIDQHDLSKYLRRKNINTMMNLHNIDKSSISNQYDESKTVEIVKLYQEGKTIFEISKIVKSHRFTIHNVLNKSGFDVEKKFHRKKVPHGHKLDPKIAEQRKTLILKLYNEGNSIRKICEITGIFRQYISKVLKENEQEIRPYRFYANKSAT